MRSTAAGAHRTGEDVGEAFTPQPSRTGLCVEQRRPRLQASHHDPGNAAAGSPPPANAPATRAARGGALQGRSQAGQRTAVRNDPAHGSAQ